MVIDLGDTACDPLSLNKKCVQLYFPVKKGGWGAEYKRVKDLFHRETVFQIGVKKERKLSGGKKPFSNSYWKQKTLKSGGEKSVVVDYWIHFSPTLTCPDTCISHGLNVTSIETILYSLYTVYRVLLYIVAAFA